MSDEPQFEALLETDEDRERKRLQDKYRAVFLSEYGRDVLSDILLNCHFGCTLDPENKVQISEYNVSIMILAKCGILSGGTFQSVVNALANISPNKEVEK